MTVQPSAVGTTNSVFDIVAKVMRDAAKRRLQRLTLGELLIMPAHYLDDLGIIPADVIDALNARSQAGQILAARRAARATAPVTKRQSEPPGLVAAVSLSRQSR